MLVLVRNSHDFAGIIGTETNKKVDGNTVCIGDIVRVAEGSNNRECVNIVGVFTDKISVMGLGSVPISKLNIVEIVHSHKDLEIGSKMNQGYYSVREFQM